MSFPKAGVFFLLYIFLNDQIVESQKCQVCEARDFGKKTQTCTCPEDQFCDTTKQQCGKCNECYDHWKNTIGKRKNEIVKIFEQLIRKYEADLPNMINDFREAVERTEKQFGEPNSLSVKKVKKDLDQLQKKINEIEKLLKDIGNVQPQQHVVNYLKKVKDDVNKIRDQLKKLKFDVEDTNIDEYNSISNSLADINKKIPNITNDSLNLALSLESDIELLEAVISEYNYTTDNSLGVNTNWIEKELLWLFTLLNNYHNVSFDTEGLINNARNTANRIDQTLQDLLKKDEEISKLLESLKSETQFYKELKEEMVQQRLKTVEADINEYIRLNNIRKKYLENLQALEREYNELVEKQEQFERYKVKLDKLAEEQQEVLGQFEILIAVKPVAEVINEIKDMIVEIKMIRAEILGHCSSKKE